VIELLVQFIGQCVLAILGIGFALRAKESETGQKVVSETRETWNTGINGIKHGWRKIRPDGEIQVELDPRDVDPRRQG
jgi:hypothetical protein